MLGEIDSVLTAAGIDPARFELVRYVPSLPAALRDLGIDLYMGSMPRGGGKATVEGMAAGVPLLIHSNYRTIFYTDQNEVYPSAFIWQSLEELETHLGTLTPAILAKHAAKSLAHYEAHHRPELLGKSIAEALEGKPAASPKHRPRHRPNALQTFLDERAAYARTGLLPDVRLVRSDLLEPTAAPDPVAEADVTEALEDHAALPEAVLVDSSREHDYRNTSTKILASIILRRMKARLSAVFR
jgi:hypothetical protein